MEQKIERTIDNALESMAAQIYLGSIVLGIFLILLGIVFAARKASSKKFKTLGFACTGIGALAIASGFLQMWFL